MIGLIASIPIVGPVLATVAGFVASPVGRAILIFCAGVGLGWSEKGVRVRAEAVAAKDAEVSALKARLEQVQAVTDAANARERQTAALADSLQAKVDDYARELSSRPVAACTLSPDDVRRLQLGAEPRRVAPPARPGSAR